jgi:hypothetical protein
MPRTAFACALVAPALLSFGCGGGQRANYVKDNEELFRSLPTLPGAVETAKTSAPYATEEEGPTRGYTTTFRFSLPPDASGAEVAAFYGRALRPRWRLVDRLDGPVLNFRRGGAFVSINLESSRGHEVEITVDHARDDKFRSSSARDRFAGGAHRAKSRLPSG